VNREWRRGTAKRMDNKNTLRLRCRCVIREEEWDTRNCCDD